MGCQCTHQDVAPEARGPLFAVLDAQVQEHPVLLYALSQDADSQACLELLQAHCSSLEFFFLDYFENPSSLKKTLQEYTGQQAPPYVFLNGRFLGGLQSAEQEWSKEEDTLG